MNRACNATVGDSFRALRLLRVLLKKPPRELRHQTHHEPATARHQASCLWRFCAAVPDRDFGSGFIRLALETHLCSCCEHCWRAALCKHFSLATRSQRARHALGARCARKRNLGSRPAFLSGIGARRSRMRLLSKTNANDRGVVSANCRGAATFVRRHSLVGRSSPKPTAWEPTLALNTCRSGVKQAVVGVGVFCTRHSGTRNVVRAARSYRPRMLRPCAAFSPGGFAHAPRTLRYCRDCMGCFCAPVFLRRLAPRLRPLPRKFKIFLREVHWGRRARASLQPGHAGCAVRWPQLFSPHPICDPGVSECPAG